MRRSFILSFICLVLVISFTYSHPARPLYLPPTAVNAPPPRPAINLNGSAWLGKYLTTNRIFIFEPDGTLSYKISATTKVSSKNRGTWHFDGDTITFEYYTTPKNKLMEFRGKIQDQGTLVGESITKSGGKSQQTFTRTNP